MELDAVLDLQARLLGELEREAARTPHAETAARRTTDAPARPGDVALGVAPSAAAGEFRLAVRVQRRARMGSETVASIVDAAGGEAEVRYVGRVERLQASGRARRRPLVPGISVGHYAITAGTLGCFVRTPAGVAILSNNHVLADENRGRAGDAILQPGSADGGTQPEDAVARLDAFVALRPDGVNTVDAAVATLEAGVGAQAGALLGGDPVGDGALAPEDALGAGVLKVGRTTGRTTGVVTAFNVSGVVVEYDAGALRFDGQLEIEGSAGSFSLGGDSGSLILAERGGRPVGLLFAGSDQGGADGAGLTFANPIGPVLDGLDATLFRGTVDGS